MKTKVVVGIIALSICSLLFYCYRTTGLSSTKGSGEEENKLAVEVLLNWNRLILQLERYTIGYRAPVAARMYGYVELNAYECSLPFLKNYKSFAELNPEYINVVPPKNGYLPQVLNTSLAAICKYFFRTAPKQYLNDVEILEKKYDAIFKSQKEESLLLNSSQFGNAVAKSVWQYSMSDTIGHDAFLKNYDPNYKLDSNIYGWKINTKTNFPPLLPHWGQSKSFVVDPNDFNVKLQFNFDTVVGSEFYTSGMEVLSANRSFSKEQVWVAEFWSDDFPQLTMSPAGRWISITNQIVNIENPTFEKAIEVYFKMGMALNDAAIVCWNNKYKNNLLRPETYIRKYLDPDWQPLHDAPNFPSFPSGHSMFGGAAAEVLTHFFGDHYEFTDNTHKGRQEFIGNPRHFHSFYEMSKENAYSRILMGVHYRMDCTIGLQLGSMIGKKIAFLPLKKKEKHTNSLIN